MLSLGATPITQAAVQSGIAPAVTPNGQQTQGELATTMVLRGAVGTLIGAAVAPRGREGIWGAAGFVLGVTLGQTGIVAIATAALWKKAGG